MNAMTQAVTSAVPFLHSPHNAPRQVQGRASEVLADVHLDDVNLAIWQRTLPAHIEDFAARLLSLGEPLAHSLSVTLATPDSEPDLSEFAKTLCDIQGYDGFVADLTWLVSAFACLFGATCIGVRLRTLEKAMCPRFHVDHVAVRLITTYAGVGSEWLDEASFDREQLSSPGPMSIQPQCIRQMRAGDVALMKGEKWHGNRGAGLVHRSPATVHNQRRLILTLDWLA
jgi:hypothetical protein